MSDQTKVLEKCLQAKPHMEPEEKHQLAVSLNISEKKVLNWFRNRWYRAIKKGMLCEGEKFSLKHTISNTICIWFLMV